MAFNDAIVGMNEQLTQCSSILIKFLNKRMGEGSEQIISSVGR
ncbi:MULTISPECIES: hypothetical protein [unclassified Gilliamella]|nr:MULTISPECIES: hypothetical protein [unclassified Gilliamella]